MHKTWRRYLFVELLSKELHTFSLQILISNQLTMFCSFILIQGHTVISPPLILRARVVVISDGHPTDMINPKETMATTTQSEV